jgi:phage terminase Nu1 subunit (DNA packaging protein)
MPTTRAANLKRLLLTRSELALVFKVTPQRITIWKTNGMPVADRGSRGRESRFDLADVNTWWLARELQARGLDPKSPRIDLGNERALLARAQARKTMLEVQTREQQLLPRDQVVADGRAFILAVRAKLLALPRELARAGHIPVEKQADVTALIRQALEELARWTTRLDLLEAAGAQAANTRHPMNERRKE